MLRDGQLVDELWHKVVVGDVIKMENDQFVAVCTPLLSQFVMLYGSTWHAVQTTKHTRKSTKTSSPWAVTLSWHPLAKVSTVAAAAPRT